MIDRRGRGQLWAWVGLVLFGGDDSDADGDSPPAGSEGDEREE